MHRDADIYPSISPIALATETLGFALQPRMHIKQFSINTYLHMTVLIIGSGNPLLWLNITECSTTKTRKLRKITVNHGGARHVLREWWGVGMLLL